MFLCLQPYIHPIEWRSVPSGSTQPQCLLCIIQYLQKKSVSLVQKQVCLTLLQQLIEEDNENLIAVLQANIPICKNMVELCMGKKIFCFSLHVCNSRCRLWDNDFISF